jgi:hypothetical protein
MAFLGGLTARLISTRSINNKVEYHPWVSLLVSPLEEQPAKCKEETRAKCRVEKGTTLNQPLASTATTGLPALLKRTSNRVKLLRTCLHLKT